MNSDDDDGDDDEEKNETGIVKESNMDGEKDDCHVEDEDGHDEDDDDIESNTDSDNEDVLNQSLKSMLINLLLAAS